MRGLIVARVVTSGCADCTLVARIAYLNRTDFDGDSTVWRNMESWHKNAPPASGGIHRNCENERSGWWPSRTRDAAPRS